MQHNNQSEVLRLQALIKAATSIVITSHLGADPDAICSCLLLAKTISENYPKMPLVVSIEESSYEMDFIDGYKNILISPLQKTLSKRKPDLLFILDANNLARCTRTPELADKELTGVKVAIIDHHEPTTKGAADVYINQESPATTEDIYDICFNQLKLRQPQGYQNTALTGIYSDTGGFVHIGSNPAKTFSIVSELIAAGADMEAIHAHLSKISPRALKLLTELFSNTASYKGFTYSFIPDDIGTSVSSKVIKQAIDAFTNSYLINIGSRQCGFVIYKDQNSPVNAYKVSLRSLPGLRDVSKIANSLGGGGHKPAAGALVEAADIVAAIDIVKQAISENHPVAVK